MGTSQSVTPNVSVVGPYANTPFDYSRKVTPIQRENDNTSAIERALLQVHQKWAHLSVPDDASGRSVRRGSFNPSSLADPAVTGIPG